jgi:hypothetical protein
MVEAALGNWWIITNFNFMMVHTTKEKKICDEKFRHTRRRRRQEIKINTRPKKILFDRAHSILWYWTS